MSCPRCDARAATIERQAEEIRMLRRELGFQREAGQLGSLMAAFAISPSQARILLRLYAGGGRVVRHLALAECVQEDADSNAVAVHISRMRRKLDPGAITNIHGVGYGLSAPFMSRMMAILEPPELQDARPAG